MKSEFPIGTLELSPAEFELEVARYFRQFESTLQGLSVEHRAMLVSADGDYEIDVCVKFEAFGVEFTVLVECKHHKYPIKRDVVQILHKKMQSLGAQKGVIVSTAYFQEGAVQYAKSHHIALLHVENRMVGIEARDTGGCSLAIKRNDPNFLLVVEDEEFHDDDYLGGEQAQAQFLEFLTCTSKEAANPTVAADG